LLVIASHPDDAELGCGGTIIAHQVVGKQVGVLDLTKGEMGTRGTPDERLKEADQAAQILGLSDRKNAGLPDAFFEDNEFNQKLLASYIRYWQPEIVLANAITDRHPDHGRAAQLIEHAVFLAGLRKITTTWEGQEQEAWRPKATYHFIQSRYIQPHFIMDVSAYWDRKMEAISAYRSQFFDPRSEEPETYISKPGFMEFIHARGREFGQAIGVAYGEGFTSFQAIGVGNLFDLIS